MFILRFTAGKSNKKGWGFLPTPTCETCPTLGSTLGNLLGVRQQLLAGNHHDFNVIGDPDHVVEVQLRFRRRAVLTRQHLPEGISSAR